MRKNSNVLSAVLGRDAGISRILCLALLSVLAIQSAPSHARTWVVDQNGAGDFLMLQDAGDVAADGDTILIYPGRYLDFRPYDYGALTEDTALVVKAPNVTVRGTDRETVIIGPEVYSWPFPGEPNGISMAPTGASGLVIEDLTIENIPEGAYFFDSTTVRRCTIRGCRLGIGTDAVGTIVIEEARVQDTTTGFEMAFFGPIDSVIVERSTFNGRGVVVSAQQHARFSQSVFDVSALTVQLGSNVVVEDCRFKNGGGITTSDSDVRIVRSSFVKARSAALEIRNGTAVGEDNLLLGASDATILCSGGASLTLRRCHLYNLSGSLPTVWALAYLGASGTIDLRENWWGTTDPAVIEAGIVDGADNPGDAPVVMWDPFLNGPVPAAESSVGALKSRFLR